MKKRKAFMAAITSLLVLALAACGGGSTQSAATTEVSEAAEEQTASGAEETERPGQGATKMGILFEGTSFDYGYDQSFYEFGVSMADTLGIDVVFKEDVTCDSSCEQVMEQMIADGCGIIYATAYGHREFLENVAANHPEVAFYTVSPYGNDMDNVCCISMDTYDAFYVEGVAAGLMTKTNNLGFVAAFQMSGTIAAINAFTLGAQSVNPDVIVQVIFTNDWYDAGVQVNAVNALLSQNVDVIGQFLDYTKTVVDMCEENGIYSLGVLVDTSEYGPNSMIMSYTYGFDVLTDIMSETISGDFTAGIIRGDYSDGMVSLTPYGSFVPDDVVNKLDEVAAQLQAGELDYFAGPIYNQSGEVAVPEGTSLTATDLDSIDYFVQGVVGLDN